MMKDYITEFFVAFDTNASNGAATPVTRHLFEINQKSERLTNEKKAEIVFHHIVAKLLYVPQCARIDTQLAAVFLMY